MEKRNKELKTKNDAFKEYKRKGGLEDFDLERQAIKALSKLSKVPSHLLAELVSGELQVLGLTVLG